MCIFSNVEGDILMSVEDKAVEVQERIERKFSGIGKGKYARIIRMAKKPDRDEYLKVLLITGFGIVLLGLVGFIIYLVMGVYFKVP
ncbi:MAG: protein translocase SEC61 complex subunit gamma [Candidatus Thermoplasmatota archaeon]|nr:protein translocase SEC61 complex subunit gamma [Candidatus Thermoplasmatota archaeon]